MTVATGASLCLLAGGLLATRDPSATSPGAPPTTDLAESSSSLTTTTATPVETTVLTAITSTSSAPTTLNPGFVDGAAASAAAEQLLAPYISSEFLAEVTEPACSQPPTGSVGETFACYALKPDDLVIALRATIGDDRLISLELITDQIPTTTTTTTTTTSPPTVEASDTTVG